MALDFLIVVVLLICALVGALRGFARQIAQLISVYGAYLAAQPLREMLQPQLPPWMATYWESEPEVALVTSFVAGWLLLSLLFGEVVRRFLAGDDLHRIRLDRILGSVFSTVRAAVVLYLIVAMVTAARGSLQIPFLERAFRYSTAYALVQRHNVFETDSTILADLGVAQPAFSPLPRIQSWRAFETLKTQPRFKEILNRPSMKAVVEKGDPREVLKKLLEEVQNDRQRDLENATVVRNR
jgi:uncharacterized membrane protein required for colicin V production